MTWQPDFEQIARFALHPMSGPDQFRLGPIVEALRQVWNARGAADIARLEALDVMVSADTLRSLDR